MMGDDTQLLEVSRMLSKFMTTFVAAVRKWMHGSWLRVRAVGGQCRPGQARDDDKAINLSVVEGFEESIIVSDRDAAVRIAIGSEHVAMREQPGTPVRGTALGGDHAQRLHAVKQSFARLQLIDGRRGRGGVLPACVLGSILQACYSPGRPPGKTVPRVN